MQCQTCQVELTAENRTGVLHKENRPRCNDCKKVADKSYRDKVANKVFDHYGRECVYCGSKDNLEIDHIDANGAADRRELKVTGGYPFYRKLVQQNYPVGYQTMCKRCNRMKGDNTEYEFVEHMMKILNHVRYSVINNDKYFEYIDMPETHQIIMRNKVTGQETILNLTE